MKEILMKIVRMSFLQELKQTEWKKKKKTEKKEVTKKRQIKKLICGRKISYHDSC